MTQLKDIAASESGFADYPSTQKLQELAARPYDLTQPGNLSPQRINHYTAENAGYKFFYATERVDDEVLETLVSLAKEAHAVQKMKQMQAGEIVNTIHGFPSENRPALHTALRDFFENQNKSEAASDAAKVAREETEKLQKFLSQIDKEKKYTDLILASIGGSDLGPKAHYLALRHLKRMDRHVHFISNVDPDEAALAIRNLNLKHSLVLVISKSGTTLETATMDAYLRQRFKKAGLRPEEHFIAVTTPGSKLDDPKKYLKVFYTWDWVGGRYSVSSLVGGVLLSYAFGFENYWEFLHGASEMDKAALNEDVRSNVPLLGALLGIWNRNFLRYPNVSIVPYSAALGRYPAHIQQLDMESNGKRIDKNGRKVLFDTGPIILGEPGTSAQHSFYQLIHQGTTTLPLELIGFRKCQMGEDLEIDGTSSQEKLNANLFAQMIALARGQKDENPNKEFPGNRPSHLLFSKQLTPFSLGALLGYFEHKIAFQGFIWNINSFDQEGVQLGKVLANKILDRIKTFRGYAESEPYPLGDEFLKELKET